MVERHLLHYIIALYPQYARPAFPEYADDDEDNNVESNSLVSYS